MSRSACHEIETLWERHVAGTLSVDDAAALASHALGCERCASDLHRVRRRGGDSGSTAPASRAESASGSAWRARRPLAVAAAAVVVAALAGTAIWQTETRLHARQIVVRGRGGDLLLVAVRQADGTLRLTWPRTAKAVKYDVVLTGNANAEVARSVTLPVLVLQSSEMASVGDIDVAIQSTTASGEHSSRSTHLRLPKAPPAQ